MPIPFAPVPPAEASDGSRFCDPIWQRWFTSLSSSMALLLKQFFPSSGGTISGSVTITTDLTVQNNATVTHTVTCQTLVQTSDERLKHRWRRLPENFVDQLASLKKSNRAGTFGWRSGGSRAAGVGAQSVERFCPAVVIDGEDGLKRIDYGVLGVLSAVELADRLLKAEESIELLRADLGLLQDRMGQSGWREGRR